MQMNDLTFKIIGCAYTVHSELGPGLLESAYRTCLEYQLRQEGLDCVSELPLPVRFHDIEMKVGYRVDLLVEDRVIVELKAVEKICKVHEAQLLTYLRLSGRTHGLLFNFNEANLRNGLKRMINT